MSDYNPLELRKLWEEFQACVRAGNHAGFSIYLHNQQEFVNSTVYQNQGFIHRSPLDLELRISQTLEY